jgi:deazaflavin-dependent oxidoreductase (nitroreductase family)
MASGEYIPSTWDWVREQVEAYEASGGAEANTLRDTGIPIIVMTCTGRSTGAIRKVPLMRVEHEGDYALIASKGGRPEHPGWYHNLVEDPSVTVQDGPEPFTATARLVEGAERDEWWARAVSVFPSYQEYQDNTERVIPVFVTQR